MSASIFSRIGINMILNWRERQKRPYFLKCEDIARRAVSVLDSNIDRMNILLKSKKDQKKSLLNSKF